jgi:hypothetical protein
MQVGRSSGVQTLVFPPSSVEPRRTHPDAGDVLVVTSGVYVDPTRRPRRDLDPVPAAMTFDEIEGYTE